MARAAWSYRGLTLQEEVDNQRGPCYSRSGLVENDSPVQPII
jgi:hypothetical protein